MHDEKETRTYVLFVVPHKGALRGDTLLQEVENRDLQKLVIPPKATSFRFYDVPENEKDPRHFINNEAKLSGPEYLIARTVLSQTEAVLLHPLKDALKGKSGTLEKGRKLTDRGIVEAVWKVKYGNPRAKFALFDSGFVLKIERNMIVIDRFKNQLYPNPNPRKKKASADFNTSAQKEIVLAKPLRLKLKKPPAP